MAFAELKKQLPDFAKDVKLSLSLFDRDETPSVAQKGGLASTCGTATRSPVFSASARPMLGRRWMRPALRRRRPQAASWR
jgi:hypothetical protein